MKNTVSEMKNTLDTISILVPTEEKISKLKDTAIGTI